MLNKDLKNVTTSFGFYHFLHDMPEDLTLLWKNAGKNGGLGNQEFEYCRKKIFICNALDISNPDNRFSMEFGRLYQPSEREVAGAMIWGDNNGYQIKAGGGAMSECAYVSVLKGLISDKQGLDKEVLVIKKFSTRFKDVLITGDEIAALEQAVMAKPAKSKALYDDLCLTIRLLIFHYRGLPTMNLGGNKKRRQTKSEILQYWDYIKNKYPSFIIKKYFSRDLNNTVDEDIYPIMLFIQERFELLAKVKNVSEIERELTADFMPEKKMLRTNSKYIISQMNNQQKVVKQLGLFA